MKDDFFMEQVTDFFARLQLESLRNLRATDDEYKEWRIARAAEATEEYNALLDGLPQNDRERDWVYLQGHKDCVKFLRLIELIG